jgi:hypothetical protein
MASFAFTQTTVTVNAAFLKKPQEVKLVQVPDAAEGHIFFHCATTNGVMKQLLVDDRFIPIFDTRAAALRKSNILGLLKKQKDIEWNKHVELHMFNKWKSGRYNLPSTRSKVLEFPKFIEIDAPKTATVGSMSMTIHLTKPTEGLVMRLTPEVLHYLRAVVTEQLDAGGCSTIAHARTRLAVADRVDTGVRNLFWSYAKNKYRAVYYPVAEDDGNTPRCMEFLTPSKKRAVTFIKTGVRGKASDDDEDRSLQDPSEAGDEDVAEDGDETEDEDMAEVVNRVRKRPSQCSATPYIGSCRRVHRR